jgi:hypothetical protein
VAGYLGLAGQTYHEGAADCRALVVVVGRQRLSWAALGRPGDGPSVAPRNHSGLPSTTVPA